ncbi:MAG: DUF4282 domain-containing protein [Candidatus Calescibacterium sp.]|nr:DUF4282 domain-containing protein [Candidatus Calescibacterium sp.]MCX7734482.1 DUF4282 domain-containing protein [bacterium]MDW8087324.1 DUF4282 domain-containing protein [Candidatus Calescibacterium sp.]
MEKGFWRTLFDFSFRSFVTISITKLLYIIGIILAAIVSLIEIMLGMFYLRDSAIIGFIIIIFSPVGFIISVILIRVFLELAIVLFSIARNTEEIVRLIQKGESN